MATERESLEQRPLGCVLNGRLRDPTVADGPSGAVWRRVVVFRQAAIDEATPPPSANLQPATEPAHRRARGIHGRAATLTIPAYRRRVVALDLQSMTGI
jgi:hypothetical protein